MDEVKEIKPGVLEGKYEYGLFLLDGNIDKELNKLGDEGWIAFGFIPQQPDATGQQKVLVPCHRPKRLIANPNGNGIALLQS
jgi:hypothetical protein